MRHPSSVYVVDSHAAAPPIPNRVARSRKRSWCVQTLLSMLVSVALTGFILEAVLIFYLHSRHPVQAASSSLQKLTTEKIASAQTSTAPVLLFKPVARLTGVKDVIHNKGVVSWSRKGNPLLRGIDYNDKSLLIHREGFYFVYSKLSFSGGRVFHHSVMKHTGRHPGGSVTLLKARKYSSSGGGDTSNSFLGGVFNLEKDDTLFVQVSDMSKIVQVIPYENVFGAFMI
ncbi:tumor necrosis factor ligand superfamily member 14-like [Corythoichthys intestinalis]|uniref:tumor necrosis factor ligand superfamily member 14-like n=1 Tax=Corythoichthys intestinalis TaxID=161448 RepID=UPI0025A5EE5F|nr:tumor necrosis factor ligand superfamily member 14-like [Corythoichthys intestinalis]